MGFSGDLVVKNPPDIAEDWVGKIPWRREQQEGNTSVLLAGEFHGQRSLAGYSS